MRAQPRAPARIRTDAGGRISQPVEFASRPGVRIY